MYLQERTSLSHYERNYHAIARQAVGQTRPWCGHSNAGTTFEWLSGRQQHIAFFKDNGKVMAAGAAGSAIGAAAGAIGGPFGSIIGGAIGAAVGSAIEKGTTKPA